MGNANSIPEAQRTMQRQLQYCQEMRTQLECQVSSLETLAWRRKDEIERNMVSVCSSPKSLRLWFPFPIFFLFPVRFLVIVMVYVVSYCVG